MTTSLLPKIWMLVGAIYGLLAVAVGAFGAHALRSRVSADMLVVWKTGVEYHFYHALALLLVGWFARTLPSAALNAAGLCFTLGVLFFSGSLYALVLSDVRVLGAVTPFGGLLFMIGWALLAWVALKI